jgi:hypothetical protein
MYYTCRADLDMVQHYGQMVDDDLLRDQRHISVLTAWASEVKLDTG